MTGALGLTNGAALGPGEMQVEWYCLQKGYDTGRNRSDWYCINSAGARVFNLQKSDFDEICRATYKNQQAFAIQDGDSAEPAKNWRCYAYTTYSDNSEDRVPASPTSFAAVQSEARCSGAPSSRLTVGKSARVLAGEQNALRRYPRRSNNNPVLELIPSGTLLLILDGPQCADGYAWWQVRYEGILGWTPEGEPGDYWLGPE